MVIRSAATTPAWEELQSLVDQGYYFSMADVPKFGANPSTPNYKNTPYGFYGYPLDSKHYQQLAESSSPRSGLPFANNRKYILVFKPAGNVLDVSKSEFNASQLVDQAEDENFFRTLILDEIDDLETRADAILDLPDPCEFCWEQARSNILRLLGWANDGRDLNIDQLAAVVSPAEAGYDEDEYPYPSDEEMEKWDTWSKDLFNAVSEWADPDDGEFYDVASVAEYDAEEVQNLPTNAQVYKMLALRNAENPVNLTKDLMELGFDAIVDPGLGVIHVNERDQVVVLNPGSIQSVTALPNPMSRQTEWDKTVRRNPVQERGEAVQRHEQGKPVNALELLMSHHWTTDYDNARYLLNQLSEAELEAATGHSDPYVSNDAKSILADKRQLKFNLDAAVNPVDEAPESHDDAFWDTKQPGKLQTQDTNFPAGEINDNPHSSDPWASQRKREEHSKQAQLDFEEMMQRSFVIYKPENYDDKFNQNDFRNFVRLLQRKSVIDAKYPPPKIPVKKEAAAQYTSETYYHGGTAGRTGFDGQQMDRDRSSQDLNAQGPGIYLTEDKAEAHRYAGSTGSVYTVEFSGQTFDEQDPVDVDKLKEFVGLMPLRAQELGASNYNEDLETGLDQLIQNTVRYNATMLEALLDIKSAAFPSDPNLFAELMTKIGYNALKADNHLIVYSPSTLSIQQEENVRQATPQGHELGDLTESEDADAHTRQQLPIEIDDAARWNDSYSSENQYEDPNLKLGARIDHRVLQDKMATFTAHDDETNEIIGKLQLLINRDEGQAKVWLTYVEPEHQGQGLGRELYRQALQFAKDEDLWVVSDDTVSESARKQWQSLHQDPKVTRRPVKREDPTNLDDDTSWTPEEAPELHYEYRTASRLDVQSELDDEMIAFTLFDDENEKRGEMLIEQEYPGSYQVQWARTFPPNSGWGKQLYGKVFEWAKTNNVRLAPDTVQTPAAKKIWEQREASSQPVAAVDLDGTLLEPIDYEAPEEPSGQPALSPPMRGASGAMGTLQELGWRVIIHTARLSKARSPEQLEQMVDEIRHHLQNESIHFDEIATGQKPVADVYIDDHATHFDGDWWTTIKDVTKQAAGLGIDTAGDGNDWTDPVETRNDLSVDPRGGRDQILTAEDEDVS